MEHFNSNHTVISIGRGGEKREYKISDENAAIVDAFLEKTAKKKQPIFGTNFQRN